MENQDEQRPAVTSGCAYKCETAELASQSIDRTKSPGPGAASMPTPKGTSPWLIVLGSFLSNSAAFGDDSLNIPKCISGSSTNIRNYTIGLMNAFGTFQTFYQQGMLSDESTSAISWIGSVQLFLLFLGGIAFGPILDSCDPRQLMVPGSVICLSSFICVSFASRYWQILITQGVIFGVGNALLYYPTTTVIARSFSHNRSLALGVAASGSSIGGIYWPLIVEKLLNRVGFQWTHRAVAVICLPLFALGCLMVRERATETARSVKERPTAPSVRTKTTTLLRDAEYVLLSVSLLFIYMGMLVPFYYIPLRAIYHGISDDTANSLLPICYASSFLGRVITGAQADHLGRHEDRPSSYGSITANYSARNRFNTLIIMSVITGIGTLCWTFMSTFSAMVSFAIIFGFCSGGLIPLGAGCVAQITPETGSIGLRIGATMALSSVGALVGGPIGGSLLELGQHGSNWAAVNYFSGITVLVGSAITVCVRVRWRGAGQVVF